MLSLRAHQNTRANFDGRNPLAVRIQAGGQLYGRIDKLNADVSQLIPEWNGTAWVDDQKTSNPAWIYRKYLMGWFTSQGRLIAGVGLSSARIDDDQIKAWGEFCDTNELACNIVIDDQRDHFENLKLITQCGWASVSRSTGKWGVIYEEEQALPVALFTPANIVVDTVSVTYENDGLADEIVGTYFDADADYAQNALRRNTPGISNPERPVEIRLQGITDSVQAAKEINRTAAAQFYHNRLITFETGIEGETVDRGDVVLMTSQLISGGSGGRLMAINSSRDVLTITGIVTGNGYAWVSLPDGNVHGTGYVRQDNSTIRLDSALDDVVTGLPDHPETYRYTLFDAENYTRLYRVTSKVPAPNRRYRFTLRDDPSQYYDHRVEDLTRNFISARRQPAVTDITVTESVKEIPGGYVTFLNVYVTGNSYLKNVVVKVSEEVVGSTIAGELLVVQSPIKTGSVVITATPGNEIFSSGDPFSINYEVAGKNWLPPAVNGFSVAQFGDGTRIFRWNDLLDEDVRQNGGYEIRHALQSESADFDDMEPLINGLVKSSPIELNRPPEGAWRFGLAAVDSDGRYGNPSYVSTTLGPPRVGLSIYDSCPALDGWPGMLTGAERDGTRIVSTSSLTWTSADTFANAGNWRGVGTGAMAYVSEDIDLREEYTLTISSRYSSTGETTVQYRIGSPYGAWTDYNGGAITARYIQIRWSVSNASGQATLNDLCFALYEDTGQRVPAQPQNLEATPGNTQVSLTWGQPADLGGLPLMNYEHKTGESGAVVSVAADVLSAVVGSLTNEQEYEFFVRAVNSLGAGPFAGPVTATPSATVVQSASAPTINISGEANIQDDATLQLTSSLSGGIYDNVDARSWSVVSGGGSINASGLYTPVEVTQNTSVVVRRTVRVSGNGTTATDGTFATATEDVTFTVRHGAAPPTLPVASAPSLSLSASVDPVGLNGTSQITAVRTGGDYDTFDFAYGVSGGGSISSTGLYSSAGVTSRTNVTITVTIAVQGNGTNAQVNTEDEGTQTITIEVNPEEGLPVASAPSLSLSASVDPVGLNGTSQITVTPGDDGVYDDIDYAYSVSGGGSISTAGLYSSAGVTSRTDVTITVLATASGDGTTAQSSTEDESTQTITIEVNPESELPVASAPFLSLSASVNPVGLNGTSQITVIPGDDGVYDDIDYAYSVSGGGSISNSGLYSSVGVTSRTNVTITVTATATGNGTDAQSNTEDESTRTITLEVNPESELPVASAPSLSLSASVNPVGLNGTSQITVTPSGGVYDDVDYAYSVSGGGSISGTGLYSSVGVTTRTDVVITVTATATGDGTDAQSNTEDESTQTITIEVNPN